jgi:ADP-ribosyl-[dinitrogen reductase] hydrolase
MILIIFMMGKLKSKYIGCILGAAIGDALGKQNEGLNRYDILKMGYRTSYGKSQPGCPGEKLKPGQYTDDTEQMLVLASSIIKCHGFDVQDFSNRIAQWGKDILSDPTRKTFLGPASSQAINRLNSGTNWKDAGSDISSCGSAVRVAPIGLFYKDLGEIESKAALSSLPTHNNQGSVAGAVAVAVGVRCAIMGLEHHQIIKESSSRASKYDIELANKIEISFKKRYEEPDNIFSELGTSYSVYETVPCAFYCFSRYFDSPEKVILEGVNAGGDTDSIACIAGALCGALYGKSLIPDRWINGLENRKTIEQIADQLFQLKSFTVI